MNTSSLPARWRGALQQRLFGLLDLAAALLCAGGALRIALVGKLLAGLLLLAVAGGFMLRWRWRRARAEALSPPPAPTWVQAGAALLATVPVAVLVEAVYLPVRFDQPGFEMHHWLLVLAAWALVWRGLVEGWRRWRAGSARFTP